MECRTFSWFRFDPYPPAVAFNDFLADGETDPGARVFFFGMQTLEHEENPVEVFRRDADTVATACAPSPG